MFEKQRRADCSRTRHHAIECEIIAFFLRRQSAAATTVTTASLIRRRFALGGLGACVLGGLFSSATAVGDHPWETGQPASEILNNPSWPPEFPLEARHLKRLDESPDTQFYSQPRVNVQHIDQYAVLALSKLYAEELPAGGTVLDIMSSWTSHLAQGKGQDKADGHFARVSAVGMHDDELKANPALHDYVVHDMNAQPRLAMYADASFDAVFCSVSVDYLSAPLPIFREIHRVLKPGGLALFTWSNRMFPTKAITAWREASEPARLWICGSYFHYSVPGGFSAPTGRDLSPYPGRSDPVYAVSARKVAAPADGGKQEL